MTFSSQHARWQAVCVRDASAHSSFVYAVTTTRIYCRPTCPARLARRANVTFFDTSDAAVTAGYRACKRCKPESGTATSQDRQCEAVKQACEILQKSRGVSKLKDVAKQVGLSPRYFHAVFKQGMGMTPAQYARYYNRTEKDGVDLSGTTLSSSARGMTTVTSDFGPLCGVGMDTLAFETAEHELSKTVPTTPGTAVSAILGLLQTDNTALTMIAEADFGVSHDPLDDMGGVSQFSDLNAPSVEVESYLDTYLDYSCLEI